MRNAFSITELVIVAAIIGNDEEFPATATGQDGWVYQPATKIIHIDWPGADSHGIRYFDY